MHKEELIHLHTLMVQLKKYFEEERDGSFSSYESLHISPVHVHRSKAEHKHAIFVLGTELAKTISKDDYSGTGRISMRMEELADHSIPSSLKLEA
ncbi:metal-binding protein [Methanosarcinales archaeon ex4484_138]|nr:MAG: metal-binding protein [Methanosarcinales archaeon ex4484_138]RLG27463.1 MAG: metal-binding protein [Methanosarcinales archaeon]HHI30566.1 UPF0058 family protein [Candidatus Methanoperedenaceae archaeon]